MQVLCLFLSFGHRIDYTTNGLIGPVVPDDASDNLPVLTEREEVLRNLQAIITGVEKAEVITFLFPAPLPNKYQLLPPSRSLEVLLVSFRLYVGGT